MSTIQTQISLFHLESQLSASSAIQRTANETAFSPLAVTVLNVDETVDLGDVATPKQVMVKLVSGDPVRIGLDGSTYPFRLVEASECLLLRLDVEGRVNTSTIVVTAEDANTTLHEQFFSLEGQSGTWGVWFDIGGGGAAPTGAYDNQLEITGIAAAALIGPVGLQLSTELAASTAFAADFSVVYDSLTDTITLTDKHTGTRAAIADGSATTGFAFATTQVGVASPVVHLLSTGTSQVVTAVAPN